MSTNDRRLRAFRKRAWILTAAVHLTDSTALLYCLL